MQPLLKHDMVKPNRPSLADMGEVKDNMKQYGDESLAHVD